MSNSHEDTAEPGESAPRKEYEKIYRNELGSEDWLELGTYADYLRAYCRRVGIEDRPQKDRYCIDLKSFFGTYRFKSGRELKIELNAKKIPARDKEQLLDEIIEWLAILGPNLRASLEMLDPCGIVEFELSFSMLLNELTSNLLKEYLPPALEVKTYTSSKILGRIQVSRTIRNLAQGQLLFSSERTRVNLESLPVLFLIKVHYEVLSALDRSTERILEIAGVNHSVESDERKVDFSLLREIKRSRAYHTDLLTNPLYSQLLEKALETDFEDPFTLERVRKEATKRRSLQDIIHLWDAYRAKRIPKPHIKDILSGGYAFKPASKLYELWTLKVFLSVLSDVLGQGWSARYENGKMFFHFRNRRSTVTLIYNSVSKTYYKFMPRSFKLRPDFILTSKSPRKGKRGEKVLLIADAKYKPRPKTSDLERMLAYLLTYCWSEPEETANGLFFYIGSEDASSISFRDPIKRNNPNARVYSLCLRVGNLLPAKEHLRGILLDILSFRARGTMAL